jgi:subtilisin family serine protease
VSDPSVYAVGLDRVLYPALAESVPLVHLAALHAMGLTGTGSKVAIGDGGIDTNHPDLASDLVDEACFCSTMPVPCCPDGTSWQTGPGSAEDDDGHGTAVAGIVGSDGIVAPVGGAPSASLLVAKLSGGLRVASWPPTSWLPVTGSCASTPTPTPSTSASAASRGSRRLATTTARRGSARSWRTP